MMDTEVIQNTLRRNEEKGKPDTTIRHASKQLMFGKKAVLLYHKNLTVKIVMPLRDYKAQYSVKINIYFSPSSISSSWKNRAVWYHCAGIPVCSLPP